MPRRSKRFFLGRIIQHTWVFLTLFIVNSDAFAIGAGLGISSVTYGRLHPTLILGLDFGKYTVSAAVTGIKSKIYYENGYMLNVMREENLGKVLFMEFRSGFGAWIL